MPRVKLFNEEHALNEAMELFWEKGYNATSLSDLTERLSLGKGSFYSSFKGKRAIFDKTFDLYRKSNIENLKALLNAEKDVKIGIRKLLEFNLDQAFSDRKRKGCFVANTCSELGGSDEQIRGILLDHQKTVLKILSDYLRKGEPRTNLQTEQVAGFIMTFLTGMNQEVKFNRNKTKFQNSIELIVKLMD